MIRSRLFMLWVVGCFAGGSAALAGDTINGFDLSGTSVPRSEIAHGGPARDGIPALDDPKFVRVSDAAFLRDDDRVLGLALDGETKAYPLAILNWHEIVNDRIGGVPVVVTYCPLCFSGMAFEATIAGRRHRFGVSGLLYNSDVLLYDRETESLWSQLLAQAISGPMKARRLRQILDERGQPLPFVQAYWFAWYAFHPETTIHEAPKEKGEKP